MANHTSTKKAIRKNERVSQINKTRVSRIRSFVKKVVVAVNSSNIEDAKKSLIVAQSELMRGVSKGVMKKNTASRKISRLSKMVKTAVASF